jgi:hypothetical protein
MPLWLDMLPETAHQSSLRGALDVKPPLVGWAAGSSSRTATSGTERTRAHRQVRHAAEIRRRLSPLQEALEIARATRQIAAEARILHHRVLVFEKLGWREEALSSGGKAVRMLMELGLDTKAQATDLLLRSLHLEGDAAVATVRPNVYSLLRLTRGRSLIGAIISRFAGGRQPVCVSGRGKGDGRGYTHKLTGTPGPP